MVSGNTEPPKSSVSIGDNVWSAAALQEVAVRVNVSGL